MSLSLPIKILSDNSNVLTVTLYLILMISHDKKLVNLPYSINIEHRECPSVLTISFNDNQSKRVIQMI